MKSSAVNRCLFVFEQSVFEFNSLFTKSLCDFAGNQEGGFREEEGGGFGGMASFEAKGGGSKFNIEYVVADNLTNKKCRELCLKLVGKDFVPLQKGKDATGKTLVRKTPGTTECDHGYGQRCQNAEGETRDSGVELFEK